jgi:hypothetical protein
MGLLRWERRTDTIGVQILLLDSSQWLLAVRDPFSVVVIVVSAGWELTSRVQASPIEWWILHLRAFI